MSPEEMRVQALGLAIQSVGYSSGGPPTVYLERARAFEDYIISGTPVAEASPAPDDTHVETETPIFGEMATLASPPSYDETARAWRDCKGLR